MKIKMEFKSDEHHRTETKDIPLPFVADRLLKLWLTKRDWWIHSAKGYNMPSTGEVYAILALPPEEEQPLNHNFFACQPIFRLYEVENWVVVKWLYSETNLAGSLDPHGWFFYHFEIGDGYHLIDVPRCCKVDPLNGDITVTTPTNITVVRAFSPSWPNQLLEDRFAAILLLDKMMQLREESPLSILLKSSQPYSGLAKQVVEELQKVKRCLVTKHQAQKMD